MFNTTEQARARFSKKTYEILRMCTLVSYYVGIALFFILGLVAMGTHNLSWLVAAGVVAVVGGGAFFIGYFSITDRLDFWYNNIHSGKVVDKDIRSDRHGTRYLVQIENTNRMGDTVRVWNKVSAGKYEQIQLGSHHDWVYS